MPALHTVDLVLALHTVELVVEKVLLWVEAVVLLPGVEKALAVPTVYLTQALNRRHCCRPALQTVYTIGEELVMGALVQVQ